MSYSVLSVMQCTEWFIALPVMHTTQLRLSHVRLEE